MNANSPGGYDDETLALARFAAAMGHPARIAIVRFLLVEGEVCTGVICDAMPLAASTVCQHLKALREAEILSSREDGRRVCYRLEPGRIRTFCDAMQITLGRRPGGAICESK